MGADQPDDERVALLVDARLGVLHEHAPIRRELDPSPAGELVDHVQPEEAWSLGQPVEGFQDSQDHRPALL
eukprot:92645-Alexandrium_andersonii.AAC.2